METIVVSRRKFTGNFDTYFKKIEEGAQLILKWGNKQTIIPPAEAIKDDTAYTKEEWDAKIAASIAQVEAGDYIVLTKEKRKELLGL
ncbi:hypothetical protein Barb4_02619 [Bacteroidales bacterium Barb4]|nr:hypothetical protein Barb4_02619 [Bacteroidales bacterium Barb4]